MKVCHLTSAHSYDDIRISLKESTSLAKNGFDTYLVVPESPEKELNGIKIHSVKKNNNRFLRMTMTVKNVFKEGLKINADVYHFHDPELLIVGWLLKIKGFIVIYDAHEDLPRAILSKHWIPKHLRKFVSLLAEEVENFFAKKCDLVICATPYITARYKKISSNVININNFPKVEELFQLDNDLIPFSQRRIVSYIGGISKIRGIEQILDSSGYIQQSLSIVLAGPVSDFYKEQTRKISSVKYIGIIDRSGVRNTLGMSIAGIVTFLPEPNHINAQPNKMFEYMSASIPVICSDFPLWRNIIDKYKCGIYVDPENPKAIAEAVNYLYTHPEEAEFMGKNGRKAIEDEFSWEKESEKLINAYNELLSKIS